MKPEIPQTLRKDCSEADSELETAGNFLQETEENSELEIEKLVTVGDLELETVGDLELETVADLELETGHLHKGHHTDLDHRQGHCLVAIKAGGSWLLGWRWRPGTC